jgi:glycosidase
MVPLMDASRGIPLRRSLADDRVPTSYWPQGALQIADHAHATELLQLLEMQNISTGELNAASLLVQIYRRIIIHYSTTVAPQAAQQAADYCRDAVGSYTLQQLQSILRRDFSCSEPSLEEAIIIWLCNTNPGLTDLRPVFDDAPLQHEAHYQQIIDALQQFYRGQSPAVETHSLFDLLTAPARQHPDDLYAQLAWFRSNLDDLMGTMLWQLLLGMDVLQEERTHRGGGPGVAQVLHFDDAAAPAEYEAFSQDTGWMGNLVLLAKSTYVWLAQLSRSYDRQITRLDEIPDEELKLIASRGFNGLWFIGIWERSTASRLIKHRTGNPAAIASAYSLTNYHVAEALGGDEAMQRLQQRAWRFGIRIGCDMVPNHMGIDSDWVAEHPDWFIQSDQPPYPGYSFHSDNLSSHPQLDVRIEDHYYDQSDAAVVYRLVHQADGRERYLYHGNDGTSIPWNDTAQLNYLLPQVREAVINQIIDIARRYPIIRFDAAMTLAKKHIQRLWFPQPGHGGAIPSRAQYAMTAAEFNAAIPQEFWREVVDRAAQEAPDTLLLAEAFWMMEGYFVRTLGMHRVYNSAFMHMLKDEENAKYRQSIRNVLEFNPQILQRFVNFMSNPDEDTAMAQFGSGDKYFGVCVLMATLPGLPMFAHGQMEGFSERYGMEFATPSRWEEVNDGLLSWHEHLICPLLKERRLFAQVEHFRLFDFITPSGYVNEDVFAYTNEFDGQRTLVIYHNRFAETSGFVRSGSHPVRTEDAVQWHPITLAEMWHLHAQPKWFTLFTDQVSGLTYIRRSSELAEQGLYYQLAPYGHAVLWQVEELQDADGTLARMHDHLAGEGVHHISTLLRRMQYHAEITLLQQLLAPLVIKRIMQLWNQKTDSENIAALAAEFTARFSPVIQELLTRADSDLAPAILSEQIISHIKATATANKPIPLQAVAVCCCILAPLHTPLSAAYGADWFHELFLHEDLAVQLSRYPYFHPDQIPLIPLGCRFLNRLSQQPPLSALQIITLDSVQNFLDVHEYDNILWFHGPALNLLIQLLISLHPCLSGAHAVHYQTTITLLKHAEKHTDFTFENLQILLQGAQHD